MIEEFEKIKKEVEQLRIKNEELNARILKIIEDDKKEEDKYKLPEPKDNGIYFTIITGEHSGIREYNYNSGYDKNNYEKFNCFLNEDTAIKRSKQVENYLKVVHYLEAVNEGWIPDWDNYSENKHYIYFDEEELSMWVSCSDIKTLSFKSKEALYNFRKFVSDDEIKTFFNPLGVK